jgi:hypothetical protein
VKVVRILLTTRRLVGVVRIYISIGIQTWRFHLEDPRKWETTYVDERMGSIARQSGLQSRQVEDFSLPRSYQ